MSDWTDPDNAPILTCDFFERAEIRDGGKLVRSARGTLTRMGRPPLRETAKRQVTLRLDHDVVETFRASGAGWQSRINEALRKAAHLA